MKEIVIEIPDHVYEHMVETGFVDLEANQMGYAILHGKVLPKGHGELIDARAFLQSINNNDYDTYNDYSNTFDWIEDAETLVEADKGDTE